MSLLYVILLDRYNKIILRNCQLKQTHENFRHSLYYPDHTEEL